MAITLGCFDENVNDAACQAYISEVTQKTRLNPTHVTSPNLDKLSLRKYAPSGQSAMTVAAVQQGLQSIGFFPIGKIDGIYGYRTKSAVRLFQEYVRSVEKAAAIIPDGQCGPETQGHLQRWMNGKIKSEWTQIMENYRAGVVVQEYGDWLALLEKVKQQYLAAPNKMLQKVNACANTFGTRKVAQWDFNTQANVHLIGIRRDGFKGKFQDIFVLLINGLIFKFQGSTDPGHTDDPRGYPFLVQGQHDYHFGWHKSTYLAMKPQSNVMVIRSKADRLSDADLNHPLEPNASINVHWGGPGMAHDVLNWSEGCQVINGTVYLNPANNLINCSTFAAVGSKQPLTDVTKTRGAYNVLLDLVTTMASEQSNGLQYMLLVEADLDLNSALKQNLEDARRRAMALID